MTAAVHCAACDVLLAADDQVVIEDDQGTDGQPGGAVVCRRWRECDDRVRRQRLGLPEH